MSRDAPLAFVVSPGRYPTIGTIWSKVRSYAHDNQCDLARIEARFAGVLYLLNMLTGIAAMMLLNRKMQGPGDAMNLVASVLYTGVTLLLWHLFLPGNAWVSSLAALVSLLGCWLPLARYQNGDLPVHITNFTFFGVYCLLIAYLILKSTFMPKAVGVLMSCAGVSWLTTMLPDLAHALGPLPLIVGMIGEGSLIVYLLIWGLREQRWQEQAQGLPAMRRPV